MKKLLLAAVLIGMISGCVQYPIIGYVVCKEHVLEHMSNEDARVISEASMIYIPVTPQVHSTPPSRVPEKYIIYVANKQCIRDIHVSPKTFKMFKLADKVKVFENSIEKIQ